MMRKQSFLSIATIVAIFFLAPFVQSEESVFQNALILNEDNSHFFGSREAGDMTLEGLRAFVDQYAGSAVTHLFLCPNAMRASFRSKSREAIWDQKPDSPHSNRWIENARLLYENDLDPYAVWIARCRGKGMSPWLSMRMNDIHDVNDPTSYMHSLFWLEHPQYWRVPNGSASPWQNRALNFVHQEVRDHQMAFVRELLERYDPDGLELDWMRFGWHLTPGKEKEEGKYLDEFVRDVRELIKTRSKKRGHPILLGVRVPAHPDAAAGLGMDGVRWCKEGWVDLLVPCPFWASSDFDIPIELWKERLGDAAESVAVAPGLEYNARPWPGGQPVANTLESAYGFAESSWGRGADALYLFNWMDSGTRPVTDSSYRKLVERGLGLDVVSKSVRRYPVCYRDTVPDGFLNGVALPVDGPDGGTFSIYIGTAPTTGDAWLIVGLEEREGAEAEAFRATVNGEESPTIGTLSDCKNLGGNAEKAVRIQCPIGLLKNGYNKICIKQEPGSTPQRIVWFELRIEP